MNKLGTDTLVPVCSSTKNLHDTLQDGQNFQESSSNDALACSDEMLNKLVPNMNEVIKTTSEISELTTTQALPINEDIDVERIRRSTGHDDQHNMLINNEVKATYKFASSDNFKSMIKGTSGSPLLSDNKLTSCHKATPGVKRNSFGNIKIQSTNSKFNNTSEVMTAQPEVSVSVNTKVVPTTYPSGPQCRKPAAETFLVKHVQDSNEMSKTNNAKTKLRPIFGHAVVRNLMLTYGQFPVIYIGAPNISDMQGYRKMVQREADAHNNNIVSEVAGTDYNTNFEIPENNNVTIGNYDIKEMMNAFLKEDTHQANNKLTQPIACVTSDFDSFPSMVRSKRNRKVDASNRFPKNFTVSILPKPSVNDCSNIRPNNKMTQATLQHIGNKSSVSFVHVPAIATTSYTTKAITVRIPVSQTSSPASKHCGLPSIVSNFGNPKVADNLKNRSNTISNLNTKAAPNFKPLLLPKYSSNPFATNPVLHESSKPTFCFNVSTQSKNSVSKPAKRKAENFEKFQDIKKPNMQDEKMKLMTSSATNNTVYVSASYTKRSSLTSPHAPTSLNSVIVTANRPGALVQFEDGVQLWVDRLRNITYVDDEPVKSWKLARGTKVAAKYSDGLFYDATVMSSYDGSSSQLAKPDLNVAPRESSMQVRGNQQSKDVKTTMSKMNIKKETKASEKSNQVPGVKLEKLDVIEESHTTARDSAQSEEESKNKKSTNDACSSHKEKENDNCKESSQKWKCSTCFLVFANLILFRKHQQSVCGSKEIMVTGFDFKPNELVKVDESSIPLFVHRLKHIRRSRSDDVTLLPKAPDGKRWFKRGTHILHRWQTGNESKWYNGKILRLLDSSKGLKCEFEVEYIDDDHDKGPYAVALYEDFPHDIRIVTR